MSGLNIIFIFLFEKYIFPETVGENTNAVLAVDVSTFEMNYPAASSGVSC